LQNASSNLVIDRQQALEQHCLAAITCLLSSFKLLDNRGDSQYRLIVRGLYDFQLYASEYWADYLLDAAVTQDALHPESSLYYLATELSSRFEGLPRPYYDPEQSSEAIYDSRLHHIQRYPLISKHVKRSIQARSLEELEGRLKRKDG
jgi:hypothetical protein